MGAAAANTALLLPHDSAEAGPHPLLCLPGRPLCNLIGRCIPCSYTPLSIHQVLESRSSVYSKLCRVHGKLDLMNIHESEEASRGGPTEAAVSLTVGGQSPQSLCCWGGGCNSLCVFSSLTEEAAAAGRDDFDSEQVSPWPCRVQWYI